jgi:hypothetical protein
VSIPRWENKQGLRNGQSERRDDIGELRDWGIQELRDSGIRELRDWGIQELRDSGIRELRDWGIRNSEFGIPDSQFL